MLNPQAPHRSRTHTHPTPTTPRPACASARRVHAALRADSIAILTYVVDLGAMIFDDF